MRVCRGAESCCRERRQDLGGCRRASILLSPHGSGRPGPVFDPGRALLIGRVAGVVGGAGPVIALVGRQPPRPGHADGGRVKLFEPMAGDHSSGQDPLETYYQPMRTEQFIFDELESLSESKPMNQYSPSTELALSDNGLRFVCPAHHEAASGQSCPSEAARDCLPEAIARRWRRPGQTSVRNANIRSMPR